MKQFSNPNPNPNPNPKVTLDEEFSNPLRGKSHQGTAPKDLDIQDIVARAEKKKKEKKKALAKKHKTAAAKDSSRPREQGKHTVQT